MMNGKLIGILGVALLGFGANVVACGGGDDDTGGGGSTGTTTSTAGPGGSGSTGTETTSSTGGGAPRISRAPRRWDPGDRRARQRPGQVRASRVHLAEGG